MGRRLGLGVLLAVLGFYVWLKLYSLHPVVSDENIYFYMARRTVEGLVPYRDFDFAHPVLHLVPLVLVEWISGGSYVALKALAPLWTLATGLGLHFIARHPRVSAHGGAGVWPAVTCGLFLLNLDTLRIASHSTGANQATALLVAGMALALRGRGVAAGLCYAASFSTAMFVAPLIAAGWCLLTPDVRTLRRTVLASAGGYALIHLPVWLLAPVAWWKQTVLFHLRKPAVGRDFGEVLLEHLGNAGMLIAATLMLGLLLLQRRTRARAAWLPVCGLAHIGIIGLLSSVFGYYFMPALPLVALGTGLLLEDAWVRFRSSGRRAALGRGVALALIALAFQLACFQARPAVRANRGVVARYTFRPDPPLGGASRFITALAPDSEVIGRPYPGFVRYLWSESEFWHDARQLADELERLLPPSGALYGDSTTAPLLARFADRRLACDLADTNAMQFATRGRAMRDDLECIRENGNVLVLVQPGGGVHNVASFREFLQREAKPFRVVDAAGRTLQIFWYYER